MLQDQGSKFQPKNILNVIGLCIGKTLEIFFLQFVYFYPIFGPFQNAFITEISAKTTKKNGPLTFF